MAMKDLSAGRLTPLTINAGGGLVYDVRPTADDLRRMGLFVSAAESALADGVKGSDSTDAIKDRLDPDDFKLLASNEALARLQLGDDIFDQMVADGIPRPDVYAFGQYSLNYHTRGADFADRVFTAAHAADDHDDDGDDTAAEFPKPSTNGPATESGSGKKTAPTAATAASRPTSGKSNTGKAHKAPH